MPSLEAATFAFKELINLLPIANHEKPADCPVCKSKIHTDAKSWINLSTGIKATYWLAFFAVGVICLLCPNEVDENTIIDDRSLSPRGRMTTNDAFRIFDPSNYAQM